MHILACDLARVVGFAHGAVGSVPWSGSFELRQPGEDLYSEPAELFRMLSMLFGALPLDLIVVEAHMSPAAQRNERAIVAQLMIHGALAAWAGQRRLPLCRIGASEVRMEVAGRMSAPCPPGQRWNRDRQRKETKLMVRDKLVALGLVEPGTTDTDRTDAIAVWKWAEIAKGKAPRVFGLT